MDLSGAPEKKKRLRSFNKGWEKKNQKKNQSDGIKIKHFSYNSYNYTMSFKFII